MARPKKIVRPTPLRFSLPEDVYAELALLLYSDLEGRVPHGAWSQFITDAVRRRLRELKDGSTTSTATTTAIAAASPRLGSPDEHGGTAPSPRPADLNMG